LYFSPLFQNIHASQQRRIYFFVSMYAVQCTAIFTFHVFSPDGPSLPLSTKILFIFWDTFNVLHVFESPYVEQDLMT